MARERAAKAELAARDQQIMTQLVSRRQQKVRSGHAENLIFLYNSYSFLFAAIIIIFNDHHGLGWGWQIEEKEQEQDRLRKEREEQSRQAQVRGDTLVRSVPTFLSVYVYLPSPLICRTLS